MSDATTISAILKNTTHGPAWHGPSVMELLNDVSAEQAVEDFVKGCRRVWEIGR